MKLRIFKVWSVRLYSFRYSLSIDWNLGTVPFRGELALQILALVLIAALLLFPAARMLRILRLDKQQTDPILKEAPRQMVEQILVLVLVVVFLAVAVWMHLGPF